MMRRPTGEEPTTDNRRRLDHPRSLAVAALLAAVAATALWAGARGGPGSSRAVVGKPAPGWSGSTLTGQRVESGSGGRSWTVLNFFATWCAPCLQETPQLAAFDAAHQGTGDAHVIGVLYLDSTLRARRFASAHHMTWPIVEDPHGDIASHYGVTGLPQSFVIRPDGTLAARLFGAVTVGKLDALIGIAT